MSLKQNGAWLRLSARDIPSLEEVDPAGEA
jgi:hypothetical protein